MFSIFRPKSLAAPMSPLYAPPRTKGMWKLVLTALVVAVLSGAIAGLVGALPVLLLLMFLVSAVYAMFDYRLGVLAAVMVLPLAGTVIMPHSLGGMKGLNPLNLLALATIFSLLISIPFRRKPLLMPASARPFWYYVALLVFGGLWGAMHFSQKSVYTETAFDSAPGYLRDVLLRPLLMLTITYVLAIAVANAKRPSRFLVLIFIAALTLPLVVIGFVAVSHVPLSVLASSTARTFLSRLGMHANEFGLLFNTVLALVLFCLFGKIGGWAKTMLLGLAGVLLVAILLTFSRGAFLGSALVVVFLLISQRRFRAMAAVICFVAAGSLFMPKAVVQRATTDISTGDVSTISAGRVEGIWVPLLSEIPRSPLIGRGMSSILWSEASRTGRIPPFGHPHNAYLGVLLDFGLLGVLVIGAFYRHIWTLYGRLAQRYQDTIWSEFFKGARVGILVMLIQLVTDDRFTPTSSQVFFWISYGVALGMSARLAVADKAVADGKAASPMMNGVRAV